jgi:hypothetical protein
MEYLMGSNVVQLFPNKPGKKEILPTVPGIHGLIMALADWGEANKIDVYGVEFEIMCTDFMNQLQIMAYKAAA